MLNTTTNTHAQVITTLSKLRQEWQEAAEDKSLLEVEGNIGMILADLVNLFGLARQEQALVLGPELFGELNDFLHQPLYS